MIDGPFKHIILRVNSISVLIFFLGAQANAGTAAVLPLSTTALSQGEFKLGLGGSYINTNSNFDGTGAKSTLPGAGSLQSLQADLFFQYGISDEITVLANIAFVQNSVTGPSTVDKSTISTSGRGPGDATVGLRYQPFRNPVRVIVDAQVQTPLYTRLTNTEWPVLSTASTVALGTGVTEFTIMGRGEYPIATDIYLGGAIGNTARTGGFSNLLPYEGYFQYEETKGIFLRLGVRGAISISDDQFAGGATVPGDRASQAIAGSQLYNGIKPSYFDVNLMVGSYIGKTVFLRAGGELPLAGKNIATAPLFTAVLGFDLGGKDNDSGYTHSNRGFQEYYLTSKVIRVNNKLRQLLIDRGTGDQIKVGELLDVFEPDFKNGVFGETVGRGRVLEVGPTRAKLQVLEYYKEITLQEGFVVRRPVS